MMRRTSHFWLSALAAAVLLATGITPVRAQDPDDQKRGVARISVANGEVSVRRGDSGDWVAAVVNAPLLTNDQISTGPNSRAEVEFDSGNALRIGGDAVVVLSQLEYNRYQMAVERGTVTFRVLRPSNADIEVDTPNVSVRPSKQGTYRILVNDTESDITARAGDVEVFTPRGSQWVYAGQAMQARGTASDPEFQIVRALPSDDWDRWNDSRDRPELASKSYQNVPPGVYGTEDLDPYGNWVNVPQYGEVWQPTVGPDWAPYQLGRWVWVDWYGWTWVSYDPWGWAPYHYGRWFNQPGYGWLWYPGVIGVRHYWSPALVGFFGFGGVGVGFGFGNVGWVPLAPYEVLHPWWGRAYYGRPGFINGAVSSVNVIGAYRNAGVRNGYTAVSGEDFRAGQFHNLVRPTGEQLRQASSINGPIPVAPERANLRFSDRPVTSAVRATANSHVYSYRQPNPVQRLSFDQQRSAFGGGSTARQSVAPLTSATAPTVHSEAGGWQRFGTPRASQTSTPAEQPRVETTTPSASHGWSRFGDPGTAHSQPAQTQQGTESRNYAAPQTGGNSFNSGGSRPESLRIAPSVVRERPSGGGGNRGGGGSRGGGGHR